MHDCYGCLFDRNRIVSCKQNAFTAVIVNDVRMKTLCPANAAIRPTLLHYFQLVVCTNNLSVLHPFWHITIIRIYLTSCIVHDPENSSSLDKIVHVRFLSVSDSYFCKRILLRKCCISISNVRVIKVSNSEINLQGRSRSLVLVPFDRPHTIFNYIPVLSSTVRVVQSARDLGVILDSQLSLSAHIAVLCRAGFYQLPQIRPAIWSLTPDAARTIVQAFIACRLD